jgi:hypothetical protein
MLTVGARCRLRRDQRLPDPADTRTALAPTEGLAVDAAGRDWGAYGTVEQVSILGLRGFMRPLHNGHNPVPEGKMWGGVQSH